MHVPRALPRAIAVALVLLMTGAQASGPFLGRDMDADWESDDRKGALAVTSTRFEYESARNSTLGDDVMTVTWDSDEALLSAHLDAREPEASKALLWRAESLVEYRDEDGDGRFTLGDPVVQRLAFESMGNADLARQRLEGGRDQIDATYFVAGTNGRITFSFLLAPTAQADAGPVVATSSIPTDLRIDRFPFREDGTSLALLSRVGPGLQPGTGYAAGGDRIMSYLAWDRFEEVDGVSTVTPATFQTYDAAESVLVFNYGGGESIRHGFLVGFARPSASEQGLAGVDDRLTDELVGNWPTYLAALSLATMVALAVAYRPWRRRP